MYVIRALRRFFQFWVNGVKSRFYLFDSVKGVSVKKDQKSIMECGACNEEDHSDNCCSSFII